MIDNQRSHAATALRHFFDEHLQQLQSLAEHLGSSFHTPDSLNADDRLLVENFVAAANNKLHIVNGYSEKLRDPIRALHDHLLNIAAKISPPIELSPYTFGSTPLVNALFINGDEVDRLFTFDHTTAAYLRKNSLDQAPKVYGLLTACKHEKASLGVGMLGNLLVRDVPQQTVNFAAHKIHTPCANTIELNEALKKYLFEGVVERLKQAMAARLAAETLTPGDQSYEARLNSLANPDKYLATLLEQMAEPDKLLSITQTHFRLSKLGIKIAADDRQCANEFDLQELIWSDNSRQVLLQIAYVR